jgi:hypothetical protein
MNVSPLFKWSPSFIALHAGVFLLIAAATAQAQQPPAPVATARQAQIDQNRQININQGIAEPPVQNATAFDAEAAPSQGDDDLGQQLILKEKVKLRPFSLFGSFDSYYTTNVALTKNNTLDDAFMVGLVGGSYQPRITDNLYGEVTVSEQFFRYDQYDILDFDSFNAGGGLNYVLSNFYDIALGARFNFNRLTDTQQGQEFYKEYSLTFTAQKAFVLSRAHYVYVGMLGRVNMTDPVIPQRNEYAIFTGYQAKLTRALDAGLYYRLSWFDYATGGREDLNQNLSLALNYKIMDWLSVEASTYFGFNNSNQPAFFDYEVINTGGGLSLNYKF